MNIIISGASRGIGYETARILGKNHRVLALARNVSLLKKLKSGNQNIEIHPFDISDEKDFTRLSSYVSLKFPVVDVLINNAGLLIKKPFSEIREDELRATFETNLFGAIRLTRVVLPFMKKSSMPHIVNIGSMGGFQGSAKFPGLSVYSSSKAALACLSECLAVELKGDNIAVNCISPGSVQTQMFTKAFPGYKARFTARHMAEFVADFSINGQKFFNGKILPVASENP